MLFIRRAVPTSPWAGNGRVFSGGLAANPAMPAGVMPEIAANPAFAPQPQPEPVQEQQPKPGLFGIQGDAQQALSIVGDALAAYSAAGGNAFAAQLLRDNQARRAAAREEAQRQPTHRIDWRNMVADRS